VAVAVACWFARRAWRRGAALERQSRAERDAAGRR
jgi:hypothetical protein